MRAPSVVVAHALRSHTLTPQVAYDIEMLRDEGFDLISDALAGGELSPEEHVRGLRLLALLCRQICFDRKPEMLRRAMSFTESAEPVVRDEASRLVALQASRIEALGGSVDWAAVTASLRSALQLGLTEPIGGDVRTFLARHAP